MQILFKKIYQTPKFYIQKLYHSPKIRFQKHYHSRIYYETKIPFEGMSKRKKSLKGDVVYVESDSTERKKEKREPDDSRTG